MQIIQISEEFGRKDDIFNVLGLLIIENDIFYYVSDHDNFTVLRNSKYFKMLDARVSKYWEFALTKFMDELAFHFYPKGWTDWDNAVGSVLKTTLYDDLLSDYPNEEALSLFYKYKKLMDEEFDTGIIKTEKLGRLLEGEYKKYFIKISDDSQVSGGYLLSLYKTLPQKDADFDEWFDNYEELEKYFKDNNLQVKWLEE